MSQGVGKSCLVLRYVRGQFDPTSKVTVGAAFMSHSVHLPDGTTIKFEIWSDTPLNRCTSCGIYCSALTHECRPILQWLQQATCMVVCNLCSIYDIPSCIESTLQYTANTDLTVTVVISSNVLQGHCWPRKVCVLSTPLLQRSFSSCSGVRHHRTGYLCQSQALGV